VSSLSFGEPIYLIILAGLVPLLAWGLSREHQRSRQALRLFGDEHLLDEFSRLPSKRSRSARLALRASSFGLILLALARPELGERPSSRARAGRDVLVLLDLSRSMNATDSGVSRLTLAKQAAAQVLAAVPDHRVGLIVFGGSAFLQLPLTANHAAVQRFLDAASTDDLGDPATDLASALHAAGTTFEHDGERGYQTVLILSDGESGSGDVGPPLARLRRARIPVFALGMGSVQGAPIPADSTEAPEQWHRDHIGRVVVTRLEEGELRRAARETNGSYARWTPDAARRLGTELARSERRVLAAVETTEREDRFQWPLGAALLALAVEPMLRARRSRRGR
jgi:Ca-activated chloride channel family protein